MLVAFRFNDRRLLSRLIAWWQRSDASHCEVVLTQSGGVTTCASASWLDGGVRAKTIDLTADKLRLYDVPGDIAHAQRWLVRHQGQGYDFLCLLGFAFRRITGSRGRWICSEACAAMLGLRQPWRYDVAALETLCACFGRRVL